MTGASAPYDAHAGSRRSGAMPRLFLSAAHKSSGKTTIAIGLAAAFAARGVRVQTLKKGPDYIDPMWLAQASGRPCFNLDFNTQDEREILGSFVRRAAGAELVLVEGNKGLHDGVDLEGRDSSAALAKLLDAPVVLVLDVSGVTRGIAPLLLGYASFDPGVKIASVVLNKVGTARQETKLRQAIERYTDLSVIGAIGRDPALALQERHLGLATPAETRRIQHVVAAIRRTMASNVDLDSLLELARGAGDLPVSSTHACTGVPQDVRLAVARDSAFAFYYADDLEALEKAGARLCFFDTLTDARLPQADGLFIGGGFPETHADRLQANTELRGEIRDAIRRGLPVYAECGGLMYLTRSITWRASRREMVGIIPADAVMYDKPQGRGLVLLEETAHAPWPVRGEFGLCSHSGARIPLCATGESRSDHAIRLSDAAGRGRRRRARRNRARQHARELQPSTRDRGQQLGGPLRGLHAHAQARGCCRSAGESSAKHPTPTSHSGARVTTPIIGCSGIMSGSKRRSTLTPRAGRSLTDERFHLIMEVRKALSYG